MNLVANLPYRVRLLGLSIVIFCLLGTVYFATATPDPDIVTVINGVEITKDAFYATLEKYPVNGEPLGKGILRQMISEILIEQAAEKYNIEISQAALEQELAYYKNYYGEEYQNLLTYYNMTEQDLMNEIKTGMIIHQLSIKDVNVTDEEVLAYFETNKAQLKTPARYQTYHIQVKTKDEALALRERLANGEDFVELAQSHSLDSVYDLGYLTENDDLPLNIIQSITKMQVNEVSEPIETSYGYHLLKLIEILPEEEANFEALAPEIRNMLINQKAVDVNEVIKMLWKEASISINWDRYKMLEDNPQ